MHLILHKHPAIRILSCISLFGFLSVYASTCAWADCQSEYTKARNMIMSAKHNAMSNKKLDSTTFMAQFQPSMAQLQAQGCKSEIMGILQLVQSEKQMLQAP